MATAQNAKLTPCIINCKVQTILFWILESSALFVSSLEIDPWIPQQALPSSPAATTLTPAFRFSEINPGFTSSARKRKMMEISRRGRGSIGSAFSRDWWRKARASAAQSRSDLAMMKRATPRTSTMASGTGDRSASLKIIDLKFEKKIYAFAGFSCAAQSQVFLKNK